jgi:low temperature requirement protein LtrA
VTTATGRMTPVFRSEDRVTPLELFFDLVFVLAITQCTALMARHPTWEGLAQGLLVLGVLWWAWVGYAWLTSVLDPEEGAVQGVIVAAMAALLVVSLCVPEPSGTTGWCSRARTASFAPPTSPCS